MRVPSTPGTRGSSIVELMVSVLLSTAVAAAAYYCFAVQCWTNNRENAKAMAQNRIRNAIERMVRDLQTVGFDPTDKNLTFPNRFGFQEATAQRIRFTTDANRDGTADTTSIDENRGFEFSGGSLQALLGNASTTLAASVDGVAFDYFDNAGEPTTTLANIREVLVTVTMVAQGRSPALPPSRHTLVGRAYVRNG